MNKITLKCGYAFDADALNSDDYELFEDMIKTEEKPQLLPSVMIRLLGEEEYNLFKEANRSDDGKVHLSDITESIRELFAAIGEAKKK